MNYSEKALSNFSKGYNCSQAVFAAYGTLLGLDEDLCLKIASGFGGGMGRMQEVCGAATGAFMAIGLKYGKGLSADADQKKMIYDHVAEFAKQFKARNSSVICKELLGCDFSTKDGYKMAVEKNLFKTNCVKYVRDASEILDGILKL